MAWERENMGIGASFLMGDVLAAWINPRHAPCEQGLLCTAHFPSLAEFIVERRSMGGRRRQAMRGFKQKISLVTYICQFP